MTIIFFIECSSFTCQMYTAGLQHVELHPYESCGCATKKSHHLSGSLGGSAEGWTHCRLVHSCWILYTLKGASEWAGTTIH